MTLIVFQKVTQPIYLNDALYKVANKYLINTKEEGEETATSKCYETNNRAKYWITCHSGFRTINQVTLAFSSLKMPVRYNNGHRQLMLGN